MSDKPLWVRKLSRVSSSRRLASDEFHRNQLRTLLAVDRAVGRIASALRETGRLDKTVFFFTSDNGLSWGEHRWLDNKICPYEECIRVPFVVVAPGIEARTDPHLVLNLDIGPTLAALAGLAKATDGRNLLPLLENPGAGWREDFLIEYWHTNMAYAERTFKALRTLRWKYVEYLNGDRELYDLAADPYELENRANGPAYTELIARLRSRLEELKR